MTPGGTGRVVAGVSVMAPRLSLERLRVGLVVVVLLAPAPGRGTWKLSGQIPHRVVHSVHGAGDDRARAGALCWDRDVELRNKEEFIVSGRLEGKVVLLAGIGSGMGRVTAQLLAPEGATVVGCDLNPKGAAETVRLVKPRAASSTPVLRST